MTIVSDQGRLAPAEAFIDTGADMSLFDEGIAWELGLDLEALPVVNFSGVGGLVREARLAHVTLQLLGHPGLSAAVEVAPDVELGHGNLIGLDVLEHFDFGLSHRRRIGYLERAVS